MGLMGQVFGAAGGVRALGGVVREVSDALQPNATRRMELGHDAYLKALEMHGAEFEHVRPGFFDRFVNGLNRLPRPALALGTMALFVYSMAEPEGFALRMQGLGHVPEPLWWLLGAIVSFYFGAREAHYLRLRRVQHDAPVPAPPAAPTTAPADMGDAARDNAALAEWLRQR
ncbi:holin family protein [Plastorhodobacter daqingensis]|uniref:Holin family protein n=1 Tax=Plastorhodobacter daqingensis TaxID=1387281 RepID=A0ABW2UFN5_9RHOB